MGFNSGFKGLITFQFIILMFIYRSACFGRSPAHHQELNDCSSSLWFYLRIVVKAVLCSWSARPRTQHGFHQNTKVKPEAATAVTELLMMGGRTPETCRAVNKGQDNKLENCCIWLVIYLNCTMMHGLTNFKFITVFTRARQQFPLRSPCLLRKNLQQRP